MRNITQSVGREGSNLPQDVSTVQFLLNRVSRDEGGPKVRIKQDGNPSEKLNKDIQIFQLHHFGWSGADGRVDPGHQTIRKLNELNTEPLTTKRFLLTQLSPNKSLRTQRRVDWFYEVLPLDGNPDLQKTLFWLGTTQRNHVTIPGTPSRHENTILTSSMPSQVSELVGRASFVTFALADGRLKSRLRINMTNGGVARAEFVNNHWVSKYHYKHLEGVGPSQQRMHNGKLWFLKTLPYFASSNAQRA